MNLLKQETAAAIWKCYREIAAAEKILLDMAEARDKDPGNPLAEQLKDAFGNRRNLSLGVPSGHDSYRLFNVNPRLAESVINAHVARQKSDLIELCESARVELGLSL